MFTPPCGEEDAYLGTTPYLGPAFEFTEKTAGAAPYLKNIHNFTYGATPSMGLSAASISGMKYGLPRLVMGVVGDLFRADSAQHFRALAGYSASSRSPVSMLHPAPSRQARRHRAERRRLRHLHSTF